MGSCVLSHNWLIFYAYFLRIDADVAADVIFVKVFHYQKALRRQDCVRLAKVEV